MRIKCLLMAVALCAMVSVSTQAQDEMRQEVSISYGAIPNSQWINAMSNIIPALFLQTTDNHKHVGAINVEYYYHTSKLVGVGAIASFNHYNEDVLSSKELRYNRTRNYYTLMPAVKFNWLRRDHWGIYNKVALGVSMINMKNEDYNENGVKNGQTETENEVHFNYQASIGVEAGANHFWGFAELGVGEQGVGVIGIRCKF